VDSKAEY